jgi:hypothetical protein
VHIGRKKNIYTGSVEIYSHLIVVKKNIYTGGIETYLPVIVVKKNIYAASIEIYLPVDQTGFLYSALSYSLVPYTRYCRLKERI